MKVATAYLAELGSLISHNKIDRSLRLLSRNHLGNTLYHYLTVPRTSVSSRKTGMIMERLRNFNELNHGEHLEQFLALIVPSGLTVDLAQSRGAGWARQKAAAKRL